MDRLQLWPGNLLRAPAASARQLQSCSGGKGLKYISGDALADGTNCVGPNNQPYPKELISRMFTKRDFGNARQGRMAASAFKETMDPALAQSALLRAYAEANGEQSSGRHGRSINNECESRESSSGRLCKTRYNTTAPMYGVSLTSGQPVTIVQKFPDLLQQVVFEVCESSECEVVRGECTQTYVPYLFLVIPLGPVTLTGQDYVLVESGCVCKPKRYGGGGAAEQQQHLPTLAGMP